MFAPGTFLELTVNRLNRVESHSLVTFKPFSFFFFFLNDFVFTGMQILFVEKKKKSKKHKMVINAADDGLLVTFWGRHKLAAATEREFAFNGFGSLEPHF